LQFLTESSNDLIQIINENLKIEYINELTHKNLIGYSNHNLIGSELWKFIHPDEFNIISKFLTYILETSKGVCKVRIQHLNGHWIWFKVKGKSFKNKNENKKLVIIFRKIYDQYRPKEEFNLILKYSPDIISILNDFIEAIPHPLYLINADDYTIETANSIALTENPSRDLTCYSLTHQRDKPCKGEFICPLEEVKKTKEAVVVNHIHFDKNGNTKYYEVHGYPILDKDGNVVQMIEYSQDVTERKKAEQELMESEEKFRTIAEESSLGLIIQQDGVTKFANSAVSDIIEYPLQEIMEQSVEDIFNIIYKEDLPIVIEEFKNRQNRDFDKINKFNCRIVPKSGKIKWIEVISKPIIYLGKRAILASMIDITIKKEVEEKLKEINRLKSEFLNRISHELKTPLISIKGFSDLILALHKDQINPDVISKLNEINHGCERLQNIINNLLATSRLESPDIKPKVQREDLTFLIKYCVQELQSLAQTRNQIIDLDIHDGQYALFEKEEIHDVISNLLTNAIKYTPPYGKIDVKTDIQEKNVVISIKDNGIGFTNDEKKKIFQQFGKIERYGQGLDLGIDGTGLGLYISKRIVESHGGKIWMESEGKNRGSTFNFSLPIIKE